MRKHQSVISGTAYRSVDVAFVAALGIIAALVSAVTAAFRFHKSEDLPILAPAPHPLPSCKEEMTTSSGEGIAIAAVLSFVAIVAVALRLWARRLAKQPFLADDYLAMAALIAMIGLTTTPVILMCARANLGNHSERLPNGFPAPLSGLFETGQLVLESCSHVPLALAKTSILFFYKRLFRGRLFLVTIYTLLALVIAWAISCFFALLLQCTPILPIDTFVIYPPGDPRAPHCVNQVKLFYADSGIDIIIDFVILLVPIPFVAKLQLPLMRKVGLLCVFLTGALATGASIARLVSFTYSGRLEAKGDADPTYLIAIPSYWTMIEVSIGIIAICLPSLRPVFRKIFPGQILHSLRGVFSFGSRDTHGQQTASSGGQKGSFAPQKPQEASEINLMGHLQALGRDSDARHLKATSTVGSGSDRRKGSFEIPRDGILVEKTFGSRHDSIV